MTGAALAQDLLARAPIELRVEDRLPPLPIRSLSKAMLAVAAGSLLVHVGLMAGALVVARGPQALPVEKEIPVEIVREEPKPVAEAPKPVPETPKVPPPKQPEPKIEEAKREPPPPEAPKPEPVKTEQPKAEPPKIQQAKLEPPKPAQPPQESEAKALQNELASLRAEQEALKADVAQAGSGKAVALAPTTDGDGEVVDYQLLVFSQLAKAKERTSFKGGVGTTGVKFMIDDNGGLARAEVTTPSGDEALDREALEIVRRAAPFPVPPKDAQRLVFANVNFVASKQP